MVCFAKTLSDKKIICQNNKNQQKLNQKSVYHFSEIPSGSVVNAFEIVENFVFSFYKKIFEAKYWL